MCLWISSQECFLSFNDLTRFESLLMEMFAYELGFFFVFFFATKDKLNFTFTSITHC